jgi:hypothetical protein
MMPAARSSCAQFKFDNVLNNATQEDIFEVGWREI